MILEILNDLKSFNKFSFKINLGNWTENFNDGKAPSAWLNSKEILSQYLKTKKSVKYAQCWNFAGTLCSCLRTLGIATRIVTCYMGMFNLEE